MNSLSQQLVRNISKNPSGEVLYQAVEITHPESTITNLYYINGTEDMTFNGQLYQARQLAIDYGSVSGNTAQQFSVAISDVSAEVPRFIEATLAFREPVNIVARIFLSGSDTDQFTTSYVTVMSQASIKNQILTLTSSLADLAARNLHSEFINEDNYPSAPLGLGY